MKYLKLFESQSIEEICKEYGIEKYHINGDGTIDVDGDVKLGVYNLQKHYDKIPLKFGEVSGHFNCMNTNLKDLVGCPKRVGMSFNCSGSNDITSLEGCPTYIGGGFWCHDNPNLWSMDYFPRHAKLVALERTPIRWVFNLFKDVYLADGGKFFTTSGSMMDFFWDCDPVYPGKVIKKRRMNNFLASIDKELRPINIEILKEGGWKIED